MKVLVTGGAGFLGTHLVAAFADRGDQVVSFDKGETKRRGKREDVTYRSGDICDADLVASLVEGQDLVVHSASIVHTKWSKLDLIRRVNIGGTENVLGAMKRHRVPRLVYVSSASVVYEGADIQNGDEQLPYAKRFAAPYAETKCIAEKMVLEATNDALFTCALRPHSIFGPGDTRLLPAILEKAKQGKLRFSVGKKGKRTDFTYVSNVVDAVLSAAERLGPGSSVNGQAYFITNGEPMDFWVFVRRMVQPLGHPTPVVTIPYPIAYGAAWARETIDNLRGGTLDSEESLSRFTIDYLCTDHFYSIDKARRDLGYEPRVDMDQGIAKTLTHIREETR